MKELMKAYERIGRNGKKQSETISYPSDYFSVQDIREAFDRREYEIEMDRLNKLILKKSLKIKEVRRKREEETRLLEEETRMLEEEQRKSAIMKRIIDLMKQGIAFEVAAKLAGQ